MCSFNTLKCICCLQVGGTATFGSNQTKKNICDIDQAVPCKNNYVNYLLECLLRKIQYAEKSKSLIHIMLKNHRKESKKC